MYSPIHSCRICGNPGLLPVTDLGVQALTGIFPATRDEPVTRGPLTLLKCDSASQGCGLLQLAHNYDLRELYGPGYGYRSGLNRDMVKHLQGKVARIQQFAELRPGDLVLDIGANDGTTLGAYPRGLRLVGMDPTGEKFRRYYREDIHLIPDFFSAAALAHAFPGKKAKVVTSFSMFYDLEEPLKFMRDVASVLDDEGIWIFEQSYMPTMLEQNAYDTICHEHLEYYALAQIKWMTDRAGLRIVDVEFNDVNGGSFSITAAKDASGIPTAPGLDDLLARERSQGFDNMRPYAEFAARIEQARSDLTEFFARARREGKKVAGLGASTKGNVLLQYCGVTELDLRVIGEVNGEKVGCVTPGTLIPIASEEDVLAGNPDYLLVLPWHFRRFFLANPKFRSRTLVFPLPRLEIVSVT